MALDDAAAFMQFWSTRTVNEEKMKNLLAPISAICVCSLFIPFDHSVRLERLIRSPHRLIRIEGGSHNDLSDFGAFNRELDQILW
jgi:hypothetical protein